MEQNQVEQSRVELNEYMKVEEQNRIQWIRVEQNKVECNTVGQSTTE